MDAKDKLKWARTQLMFEHPFFGYLSLYLKIKETDMISTVGVTKDFELLYNKHFIENLDKDEVKGVLLHELLHIALEHIRRIGNRNKELCNIAQDIIINNIIVKSNYKLPQNGLIPCNDSITIQIFDKEIRIENISQKSFEMIYDELMQQIDEIAVLTISVTHDSQNNDNEDNNNSDGDSQSDKNENQNDDSKSDIKKKIIEEIKKKLFDEHDDLNDMNEHERKEFENRVKELISVALEHSKSKIRGNIPAELLRMIDELLEPKLSWKQILYKFVMSNLPSRYTYSQPSKKSYAMGVYLPRLLKEDVYLVISIDTSGSIDNEDLKEFFSELQGIIRSIENVNAKVIFADCTIHEVVDFNAHTDIEELISKCKGGGGTSHIPIFEYIENNIPNTRLIVCFTDGHTKAPQHINIPAKVLWVLTKNGSDENIKHLGDVVWLK